MMNHMNKYYLAISFITISFYLVVTKRCEEVRFGTGLASRENSYC